MENNFITNIHIGKVRHLNNIDIKLSETERKHLILTGKNGSGKTSVLEALCEYLSVHTDMYYTWRKIPAETIIEVSAKIKPAFVSEKGLTDKYKTGNFIVAYYFDNRKFHADEAAHIEKVILEDRYGFGGGPSEKLIKYLLDLKTMQSFAQNEGKTDDAKKINGWFIKFEKLLKNIFDDDTLTLEFDYTPDYKFSILTAGREPFGFNEMSSGYSALLDIVVDLMLRMENKAREVYDIQGIVLIDEIETHLHIELQEKVMPFLTGFFPNIQFIVTTHSPFVLNSAENCIIYDLENRTCVKEGLKNYTFSGVVEGYFGADTLPAELKGKFNRYKELAGKKELTNEDYNELSDLEHYLDEIPDFLALEFSAEYQKLRLKMENRE